MTYDEMVDASENNEGYCVNCKEITTSGVEPDAENYPCEACEQNTVYGIEQAVLCGFLADLDGEEGE